MANEWTIIHHKGSAERTEVMLIPGGRLYRTQIWNKEEGAKVALTFVPDQADPTKKQEQP